MAIGLNKLQINLDITTIYCTIENYIPLYLNWTEVLITNQIVAGSNPASGASVIPTPSFGRENDLRLSGTI